MRFNALVVVCLLATALYFTYGQYVQTWIALLPIAFVISLARFPIPQKWQKFEPSIFLVAILGFVATILISLNPVTTWAKPTLVDVSTLDYMPWMQTLWALAALGIAALFLSTKQSSVPALRSDWIFFSILALATLACVLIVPTSPQPDIDVWTLHEWGTDAFVHFKNPYTIDYPNIYPENLRPYITPFGVNFAYLPGVLLWMAPWKLLHLDTRFSQIFAYSLTALLLFLTTRATVSASSRRDFTVYVPALLFLTFPIQPFFLVRGWNDGLSVLFFALAGYSLVTNRKNLLFVSINALFLLKQYNIIFCPFLIWLAMTRFKESLGTAVLKSSIAAAAVIGFFLALDWRNFLGSLYGFHYLKHPEVHQMFPDRADSMSVMNWVFVNTGSKSSVLFIVVALAIMARLVWKNRHAPDTTSIFYGLGATALGMFIFAPIAFGNYYEFALGFLFVALALGPSVPNWTWNFEWSALAFTVSRAVILFCLPALAISSQAQLAAQNAWASGQATFSDLASIFNPSSLALGTLVHSLTAKMKNHDIASYHAVQALILLCVDVLFFVFLTKLSQTSRVSKLGLWVYAVGMVAVGQVIYDDSSLGVGICVFAALLFCSQKKIGKLGSATVLAVVAFGPVLARGFYQSGIHLESLVSSLGFLFGRLDATPFYEIKVGPTQSGFSLGVSESFRKTANWIGLALILAGFLFSEIKTKARQVSIRKIFVFGLLAFANWIAPMQVLILLISILPLWSFDSKKRSDLLTLGCFVLALVANIFVSNGYEGLLTRIDSAWWMLCARNLILILFLCCAGIGLFSRRVSEV